MSSFARSHVQGGISVSSDYPAAVCHVQYVQSKSPSVRPRTRYARAPAHAPNFTLDILDMRTGNKKLDKDQLEVVTE